MRYITLLVLLFSNLGACCDNFMIVYVDAPRLDYSNLPKYLKSLEKQPRREIGHAWVYLEGYRHGARVYLEGGHSGERFRPTYLERLADLIETKGEANPVRCLWEERGDGYFEWGCGGHKFTYAIWVPLSEECLNTIIDWIVNDSYGFGSYSLVDHQCIHFVIEVLRLAGVKVDVIPQKIPIPSSLAWKGYKLHLWSDPSYRALYMYTPSTLEQALRSLIL